MKNALDASGRDIVYSLSNSAPFDHGSDWAKLANVWRTTGDIIDTWSTMSRIGFSQERWSLFGGPGHWNDPDMLVVGLVGWGPDLHPTRLKPDEQYTHISLWSLLSAPMLLGCDLARLDEFTLNLLTNDEVLEVNQDALGKQAARVRHEEGAEVWVKDLEDGSKAVGLFYTGESNDDPVRSFNWDGEKTRKIVLRGSDVGFKGRFSVRDLWRQKEAGIYNDEFSAEVPYHGVVLVKITPKK
jgi:alpha-galactosidase